MLRNIKRAGLYSCCNGAPFLLSFLRHQTIPDFPSIPGRSPMNHVLHPFTAEPMIAYFSMEIGVKNDIPTYSGGLGILAGDTIKSAADLKLPLVAVTLVSCKGYFTQEIESSGWQREKPVIWDPAKYMQLMPEKVKVQIEGR